MLRCRLLSLCHSTLADLATAPAATALDGLEPRSTAPDLLRERAADTDLLPAWARLVSATPHTRDPAQLARPAPNLALAQPDARTLAWLLHTYFLSTRHQAYCEVWAAYKTERRLPAADTQASFWAHAQHMWGWWEEKAASAVRAGLPHPTFTPRRNGSPPIALQASHCRCARAITGWVTPNPRGKYTMGGSVSCYKQATIDGRRIVTRDLCAHQRASGNCLVAVAALEEASSSSAPVHTLYYGFATAFLHVRPPHAPLHSDETVALVRGEWCCNTGSHAPAPFGWPLVLPPNRATAAQRRFDLAATASIMPLQFSLMPYKVGATPHYAVVCRHTSFEATCQALAQQLM